MKEVSSKEKQLLCEYQNFFGLMCALGALLSAGIQRLKLSWQVYHVVYVL